MSRTPRASSVVVISDLHLGGQPPAMMGRPGLLASFIDGLPARLEGAPGSALELVIAGDFVDFLATAPFASFTADPNDACAKLDAATRTGSPFAPVFDALGRHVAAGHRLTVLLGNHDVELAIPQVQAALLRRLDAEQHEVLFVDDGRAYRIGGALIEHGNGYDGANVNDWTGLGAIASALSRDETPHGSLRVSPGSEIVYRIVNPLKKEYPFIDLIQPQGQLVALLLLAFEPGLLWHWNKLARILHDQRVELQNAAGTAPAQAAHVAFHPLDVELPALREAFADVYEQLRRPAEAVAATDWMSLLFTPGDQGLAAIFARGDKMPEKRLGQIRTVLRELLLDDTSDRLDGPAEQYGEAAKRLIAGGHGVEAVVMGHTHLPRRIPMGPALYLNTGTWVDRFSVPKDVLAEGADGALEAWLETLWKDERSPLPPTYAELRIDETGQVRAAEIREARETG